MKGAQFTQIGLNSHCPLHKLVIYRSSGINYRSSRIIYTIFRSNDALFRFHYIVFQIHYVVPDLIMERRVVTIDHPRLTLL